MIDTGSTVPRRQVGRIMRRLREQAGISLMAAAQELEFSRARMYRIENGEVPVRKHDVIAMCSVYGAPEPMIAVLVALAQESKAKGWWHAYGNVVPSWFELYLGMEQAACRLRLFAPSVVPDLVQCREYAEYLVRGWIGPDDVVVGDAVAMRLERQSMLLHSHPEAPVVEMILDEGVLRRTIHDTVGMHRQLAHLMNVSARPNVSVRIVPLAAGPHVAAGCGPFTILEFPVIEAASPEPTTVYVESLTGALYLDKLAEVKTYDSVWAELSAIALSRAGSDDLIATIIKESAG